MKQIRCGDVVPGCDFVARAETEAELLRKVAEHARDAHGIREVTPDLIATVKARITDHDSERSSAGSA